MAVRIGNTTRVYVGGPAAEPKHVRRGRLALGLRERFGRSRKNVIRGRGIINVFCKYKVKSPNFEAFRGS
jgi:hypothetical protein